MTPVGSGFDIGNFKKGNLFVVSVVWMKNTGPRALIIALCFEGDRGFILVHPRNLTWNLKIGNPKRKLISGAMLNFRGVTKI